jgi:tetratricopeptide (TPR) repeat protein
VPYGVRDVARLLRLSRGTIRSLIAAGFVAPARGARGALQFSFQDLIVLRTAQTLADAKVPTRRIMRSMRELRRHLPPAMPLSGLRISAEADRVVVREGASRWQAESGQYLLEFDGDPANGSLSVIDRKKEAASSAEEWFAEAAALESDHIEAALAAYQHAINADPTFVDPYINAGRLLHAAGKLDGALRVYRAALASCGADTMLLYNLGVLLEDLNRGADAMVAYRAALRFDPDFADCHYNLSLLYEKTAKPKDAIRHMARYRMLTGSRSR